MLGLCSCRHVDVVADVGGEPLGHRAHQRRGDELVDARLLGITQAAPGVLDGGERAPGDAAGDGQDSNRQPASALT